MKLRLLIGSLSFVLATAGLPPCVGMDMSATAMAAHHCCDGETCPETVGASPHHGTAMPSACCVLGRAPEPRPPVERPVLGTTALPLAPAVLPAEWTAPVGAPIHLTAVGPPAAPAVARHLLLSVLLI